MTIKLPERARLGGYREYAPPAELSDIVAAIWSYARPVDAPPIPGQGHRLLPDIGMSIAVASRHDARGALVDARVIIIGPVATPKFFTPEAGCSLSAVRIHPEWSRDLLAAEPYSVIDAAPRFDAVSRLPLGSLLDDVVRAEAPLAVLFTRVRRMLEMARLSREAALAHEAIHHLCRSPRSTLLFDVVARRLGVSERHLRRIVSDLTGFSPKQLQRIARINRAIAASDRTTAPDWARIAGECGFYDQPHMIQEFQSLTACAPRQLFSERRQQEMAEISNLSR